MSSTALIAFGSALGGAIVGGFAAAAGNDWSQLRQMRRQARVHMYMDLLGQLSVRGGSFSKEKGGPSNIEILEALRRAAVVAGNGETRRVVKLRAAWDAYAAPPTDEEQEERKQPIQYNAETGERVPKSPPPWRPQQMDAFKAAKAELSEYLENRIKSRWSRH